MNRRDFLQSTAAAAAVIGMPGLSRAADNAFSPNPGNGWRVFEVSARIDLTSAAPARVWLPLPSIEDAAWIKPMGNLWSGNASQVELLRDGSGAQILAARWDGNEAKPVLEVTSRFSTRDRSVNFLQPQKVAPLSAIERAHYTRATKLLQTDGIVLKTANEITRGAKTDLDKARAIYEWVVENTERNPKTRGCGVGDIRSMLETRNLTGKCADLNALYVGLARAAGLPARDVYGVRVADSKYGYKSLGKSGDITKAQHCRAEVWLADFGWVPVDPADVRKVVLEERPGLTLKDDVAVAARKTLFGAWEMNWLAYNDAHDIALPGAKGPTIPFFMYPQADTAGGMLDCLDASTFAYKLTSREITA